MKIFNIQWIKSFFMALYYSLKVGSNFNNLAASFPQPDFKTMSKKFEVSKYIDEDCGIYYTCEGDSILKSVSFGVNNMTMLQIILIDNREHRRIYEEWVSGPIFSIYHISLKAGQTVKILPRFDMGICDNHKVDIKILMDFITFPSNRIEPDKPCQRGETDD